MRKFNLIWKSKREARERVADAQHEKEISEQKYDSFVHNILRPMKNLQEQNHFAEIIAESLAKGYEKQ